MNTNVNHKARKLLSKKGLQIQILAFFTLLAIPTCVLIYKAYDQLKWESYYQYRLQAEELVLRIDKNIASLIAAEESRNFSDYGFLVVEAELANYAQRSELSSYPIKSSIPGMLGYFQIDAYGNFSTPLLPQQKEVSKNYGVSEENIVAREALQLSILNILKTNELIQRKHETTITEIPSNLVGEDSYSQSGANSSSNYDLSEANSQIGFDRLSQRGLSTKTAPAKNIGRLDDLELEAPYEDEIKQISKKRKTSVASNLKEIKAKQKQVERTYLDADNLSITNGIAIFESEIDPFEISLLQSGHIVFYRKVWKDGNRYIQGFLIDQSNYIHALFEEAYLESSLSVMSNMALVFQGNVIQAYGGANSRYFSSASDLSGTLLFQTKLSEPFGDLQALFTIHHLPVGPGGRIVLWASLVIAVVLLVGLYLIYRLNLRNLLLVNQQQDFVSAVSHELKTPLTSIRMYGEILKTGWADEQKKQQYYEFIFDESERLSRLINNVLQLARMTRNETKVNIKSVSISELIDVINSKISTQITSAGFELRVIHDDNVDELHVFIDIDILIQILINLVDNALKFSANAKNKIVELSIKKHDGFILFGIRDYGPGIPPDQLKKIFTLFYRVEGELTRETVGTGIGLALVNQLTSLMHGKIDVMNRNPGAEFQLFFPINTA